MILSERLGKLLGNPEKLFVFARFCLRLFRTELRNKFFLLICHNSLTLLLLDSAFGVQRFSDIEDIDVDFPHIVLIAAVDEVLELFYRQTYDLVQLLQLLKPFVERVDERCVSETELYNLVVTLSIVSIDLKDPVNQLQSNQMILRISSIKLHKHLLSAKHVRSLQDLPQDSIFNLGVL